MKIRKIFLIVISTILFFSGVVLWILLYVHSKNNSAVISPTGREDKVHIILQGEDQIHIRPHKEDEVHFMPKIDIVVNAMEEGKSADVVYTKLEGGGKMWVNPASYIVVTTDIPTSTDTIDLKGQALINLSGEKGNQKQIKPITIKVVNDSGKLCVVHLLSGEINIKAYPDDSVITTTLLKGQATIEFFSQGRKCMNKLPIGQKSLLYIQPGNLKEFVQRDSDLPNPSDIIVATACKKKLYEFRDEEIESIMRMASRVYKVKVIYKVKFPPFNMPVFNGTIPFKSSLQEFLRVLGANGKIHFGLDKESRIVYVMK